MASTGSITILGGGPAGLAAAYYARKANIPFILYESAPEIGGNARTFHRGSFAYDSGAHRLHDKDAEITAELLALLGSDMRKVQAPSQIIHQSKLIDFPLSPLDLLVKLGLPDFTKAVFSLIVARWRGKKGGGDFESHAVYQYGRDIASRFLLDYSEKLWGRPCSQLSPQISGARLKGLTLATFIKEFVAGKQAKTEHLDGAFYYPRRGYGQIVETLADAAGRDAIRVNARITGILHEEGRITQIVVNEDERIDVSHVITTLPLPLFIRLLDPGPPDDLLSIADGLGFRDLLLVVLMLDRPRISDSATLYFSDRDVPFTRAYEPRNRSDEMAPEGKTSLCIEIPCRRDDPIWQQEEAAVVKNTAKALEDYGLFSHDEIIDSTILRMPNAYPILEVGYEEKARALLEAVDGLSNLTAIGRNGLFMYTHLHDQMRAGKQAIEQLSAHREKAEVI